MVVVDDPDILATVSWLDVPQNPQPNVTYSPRKRAFDNLRNAVRFVMEGGLPQHQRATATIMTDYGMNYDIKDIESVYASPSPPLAGAIGKAEIGATIPGQIEEAAGKGEVGTIRGDQSDALLRPVSASSQIGVGSVAQTSQSHTVEMAVTRATIPVAPTVYPSEPTGGIVVYNHITVNVDSAAFHEFTAKMDELVKALHQSNEIAGETRDKLIAEITAGMAILRSPKPDPKMIDLFLRRPLTFVAERATGAIISAVAVAALALLGKLTGMW